MGEKQFLNFDLLIDATRGEFRVRVIDSPAGQTSQEFRLPFNQPELENFLLRLGALRQTARHLNQKDLELSKGFGGALFGAVISGTIQNCLGGSLRAAGSQGAGLRIRLRIEASELASLPWEFLYHARLDRFLFLALDIPVSRYVALPDPIPPLAIYPPLRALVMISNPMEEEYPALDIEHEWSIISRAFRGLQRQGLLIVDRLEPASLSALRRQLRLKDYHIFHFVGRSRLVKSTREGVLALEDDQKQSVQVSGQDMGVILASHPSLRLAYLDACEGARTPMQDTFVKIAQAIVQQEFPAVVTHQYAVTDDTTATFLQAFYQSLVGGDPIDLAMVKARRAVFSKGNPIEWAAPVLFMGTPDGVIFELAAKTSSATPGVQGASANLFVRQGAQAGQNFPLMEISYVIGRDESLPIVIQDSQVSRSHAQIVFTNLGFWIEDLHSTNGTYVNGLRITSRAPLRDGDVIRMGNTTLVFDQKASPKPPSRPLKPTATIRTPDEIQAEKSAKIAALWTQAQGARKLRHWEIAIRNLKEILQIDPGHSQARNELAYAQQQQKSATLYAEARQAQVDENWETAIVKLQALINLDPNHPSARAELQQMQLRQRTATLYQQAQQALAQNNRALAAARLQAILAIDPTHPKAREDFEAILKGK